MILGESAHVRVTSRSLGSSTPAPRGTQLTPWGIALPMQDVGPAASGVASAPWETTPASGGGPSPSVPEVDSSTLTLSPPDVLLELRPPPRGTPPPPRPALVCGGRGGGRVVAIGTRGHVDITIDISIRRGRGNRATPPVVVVEAAELLLPAVMLEAASLSLPAVAVEVTSLEARLRLWLEPWPGGVLPLILARDPVWDSVPSSGTPSLRRNGVPLSWSLALSSRSLTFWASAAYVVAKCRSMHASISSGESTILDDWNLENESVINHRLKHKRSIDIELLGATYRLSETFSRIGAVWK